jgi:uncharacterized protein
VLAATRAGSPLRFLVLTFAISTPFWLLGAVTDRQLSADLPVSSFVWICPAVAATVLVAHENGATGAVGLLRRFIDGTRVRARLWFAPAILLPPVLHAVAYAVMRLLNVPLPTLRLSALAVLGALLAFFLAAEFEELGWTGYALERMRERCSALPAGVVLGLVWAAFHYVPLLQHGRSAGWIAWWSLSTVALRILIVWISEHTGGSVLAAALFHAMSNMSSIGPFQDFGPAGYPYQAQRISTVVLAVAAAVVAWRRWSTATSPRLG